MHYGKPTEGIWSVLKGGALANLAVASFAHLVQVIRHGLKKIQYRPGLIEGCLAGTGLTAGQAEQPNRHHELKTFNRALDLDVTVGRLAVAVGCLIGAESETAAGALLACIP